MKPTLGSEPPASAKNAAENPGLSGSPPRSTSRTHVSTLPTTFFLTREEDLNRASQHSEMASQVESQQDSRFGVESLASTVTDTEGQDGSKIDLDRPEQAAFHEQAQDTPQDLLHHTVSTSPTSHSNASPAQRSSRRPSQSTPSQPLTPLFLASPAAESSIPGTPKSISTRSLRHSDSESITADSNSQAVVSSGEEEEEAVTSGVLDSSSQLVMPSIRMPSRRPFTEKGKEMGRLKVLLTGRPGVGKTSLVRSVVQTCQDIVHVDSLSVQKRAARKSRATKADDSQTVTIHEIYASTKAYPSWWTDFEDTKASDRRRKSLGDAILERNICFVDCSPENGTSADKAASAVVTYVESQMEKTLNTRNMGHGELQELLSGKGGPMVDLILYLIEGGKLEPEEISALRDLAQIANLVPVLAKTDLTKPDELEAAKTSLLQELRKSEIRVFGDTGEGEVTIFSVSSANVDDVEMDASLLMSPEYVPPLASSDLPNLVDTIFNNEYMMRLRHASARKLVRWRKEKFRSLIDARGQGSPHHPLSPASSALSRTEDYKQSEKRYAQVRLAKWATELQKSLQDERRRYETLAKEERSTWLTERLEECAQDGTIRADTLADESSALTSGSEDPRIMAKYRRKRVSSSSYINNRDPLGLLEWAEHFKRNGWLAFQVIGSFGVIGGIAFLVARARGPSGESLVKWEWSLWV